MIVTNAGLGVYLIFAMYFYEGEERQVMAA